MDFLRFVPRSFVTSLTVCSLMISGLVVAIEAHATPHARVSVGQAERGKGAGGSNRIEDGKAASGGTRPHAHTENLPEYPIQQPCKKNEKNLDSDLCAQWFAAQSARDAADWGQIQVWLGFLSTFLVVLSLGLAWWGTKSAAAAVTVARDGICLGRDALKLSAEANGIAAKAFLQDRGMAKLTFEDFVRAREPNAFVVGMRLVDDWPSIFDRGQELFLAITLRNSGQVVARRVGLSLNRIVVRDYEGREVVNAQSLEERLAPVRPNEDRPNYIKMPHPGIVSSKAHNIEIVGEVKVLGDLMLQRPEPFRWISDRARGGGMLVETWPEDDEQRHGDPPALPGA